MTSRLRSAEEIAREMVQDVWTMTEDDGSITYRSAIEAPGGHVPLHMGPFADDAAAAAGALTTSADREQLGREVRAVRSKWTHEELSERLPRWEEMFEGEREIDRRIGERLFAMGAAAAQPAQPRDLAGRIRALSARWFNAWASLGTLDHQTDAALRQCLDGLREAERHARGCPDQRSAQEIVAWLRECAASAYEITRPVFAKVADELEAIVRECEEKR